MLQQRPYDRSGHNHNKRTISASHPTGMNASIPPPPSPGRIFFLITHLLRQAAGPENLGHLEVSARKARPSGKAGGAALLSGIQIPWKPPRGSQGGRGVAKFRGKKKNGFCARTPSRFLARHTCFFRCRRVLNLKHIMLEEKKMTRNKVRIRQAMRRRLFCG